MKQRIYIFCLVTALILSLTGCQMNENAASQASETLPLNSSFSVKYIDVGQADAALVQCDQKAMLIDGGNVADSSRIVAVLKKEGIAHLDYVICTHAHEDHVGGLSGALNVCTFDHVLAPVTEYETKAFQNFVHYTTVRGKSIEVPMVGDTFALGSSEVQILGPIQTNPEEVNNTSLVLRIVFGDTSFLFAGDAECEEEQDILETNYDIQSTVLKIGHHGSGSSTSYVFLRAIMPRYAVISVGEGNSYGHPDEAVLSRLKDAEVLVYRTDLQGDIIATSDGATVTLRAEQNIQNGGVGTQASGLHYIGNINSLKFHTPSCYSLPLEKNRIYFENRNEAIAGGYSPCGICNP